VNTHWMDLRLDRILGGAVASPAPSGTPALVAVLVAFVLVALAIIIADYWFHRRGR
jgi:hypothetical protein